MSGCQVAFDLSPPAGPHKVCCSMAYVKKFAPLLLPTVNSCWMLLGASNSIQVNICGESSFVRAVPFKPSEFRLSGSPRLSPLSGSRASPLPNPKSAPQNVPVALRSGRGSPERIGHRGKLGGVFLQKPLPRFSSDSKRKIAGGPQMTRGINF